jgi:hypothetical protein
MILWPYREVGHDNVGARGVAEHVLGPVVQHHLIRYACHETTSEDESRNNGGLETMSADEINYGVETTMRMKVEINDEVKQRVLMKV